MPARKSVKRTPTWAPKGIFLGSLRRGRVCYDHHGTKLKVLGVGEGSVSIRRSGGIDVSINGRSFVSPNKPISVSRDTVVFLKKKDAK